MTEDTDIERIKLEFEREKHQDEVALRNRELELKHLEHERSLFRSPLFLAVVAGVVGLLSNAIVALINGSAQRHLERDKATAIQELEEGKAEAARILEALKTGDPDKAAENLELLVETDLVKEKADSISAYLAKRTPGEGASLPAPTAGIASSISDSPLPSLLRLIPPDWSTVNSTRKPASQMTDEEAVRLRQAILKLKLLKKDDARSFNMLARIYAERGQFNNELFLPWNRAFLRYIEVALQEIDPNVTVPYWEWSKDSTIPRIFSAQRVDGSDNPLWESSRRLTDVDRSVLRSEIGNALVDISSFVEMSKVLEMEHNRVHVSIGGKMASFLHSMHDPLNLAVMAAVDKRWFDWERAHEGTNMPSLDQKLEPFSLSVRDVVFAAAEKKSPNK